MKQNILGDIYLIEEKERLRFGNARLELVFSKQTGDLVSASEQSKQQPWRGVNQMGKPTTILRVGGRLQQSGVVRNSRVFDLEDAQEIGLHAQSESFEAIAEERHARLEATAREGDWVITNIYRLEPGGDTLQRGIRVSYRGAGEKLLRDVRLNLPGVSAGDPAQTLVEAPDYPVTSHFPLSDIPSGIWEGLDSRTLSAPGVVQHSVDVPGSVSGLVALCNPTAQLGLMCWPHSTSEFSIMELELSEAGVDLIHWLFLADRFKNGHTVEAGTQYVRLFRGSWDQAIQGFQDWYPAVGMQTPSDRPAWACGTAIYEVHVGRAPFLDGIEYAPYPRMGDLVDDLARIADLGFEVIQVMPHWPFCGYTVHDYYQIDKQYGDESELKAMVQMAHQLGLRVILDVVLHGCVDKEIIEWDMSMLDSRYHFIFKEWLQAADPRSRYRSEFPNWFMQDESGQTARIYTWAFDHGNLEFQDYLIGVLKYYLDKLQVDGFRFDAPTWNCMPNWAEDLPYRASAAYYACFHLLERVRHEIKAGYPQALLYTEPSGPLFRKTMDLTYNYDEEWLSGSLMQVVSERGYAGARQYNGLRIDARQTTDWLYYRDLSLLTGSETVHHLDSHDTFWWGEKAQFRHEAFGLEASRSLFAMFAMIGGGIMNYVGAECGSETFYRRLLHLRQTDKTLRLGACDYRLVTCSHTRVLALWREFEGQHAIPVINLENEPLQVRLGLPSERLPIQSKQECLVYDLLGKQYIQSNGARRHLGSTLEDLQIDLPAYEVMVLRVYPINKQPA